MTPDPPTPSPDSPRTDAEVQRIENDEQNYEDRFDCWCEMIQFAKKLERELAALVKEREELQGHLGLCAAFLEHLADICELEKDTTMLEVKAHGKQVGNVSLSAMLTKWKKLSK